MLLPLLAAPPSVSIDLIWSTDCPVAQRWVTRVAAWQAQSPQAKVTWWFPVDDAAAASAYASRFHLKGEFRAARGGDLAFEFALDRFPAAVVRREHETVFAGGIGSSAEPDSRFLLAEAYAAAIVGSRMVPARSEPQGCTIPDPLVEKPGSPVSYLKHIQPVLRRSCMPCHAPGGAAPLRLDRHADAKRWSHMILDVLDRRKMPPVRLYDRLSRAAPLPAPSSVETEQIRVWREYGAGGADKQDPLPNRAESPTNSIPVSGLAWPKMGRFRYVDVALPKVTQTSGYVVTGAPQGSVRMAWTFLAPSPVTTRDQGERWKSVPHDWEFVHATSPQSRLKSTGVHFKSGGRYPVVRLQLYGTGDPRPLRFQLTPLPTLSTKPVHSIRFPIEKGRFPSFDGAVEQTSIASFSQLLAPIGLTVVGDPSPSVLTVLGPSKSWLIGEFTPNSMMPSAFFTNPSQVERLALNLTYGGHSITGERGPTSMAFGDQWNETRLEAFLIVPSGR